MTRSTFKTSALLPLIAVFLLFGILLFSIYLFTEQLVVIFITVPVCLAFIFWIVWGELRTKAVKVTIGYDRITVNQFLGYGATREYFFSEIEGYIITLLPAEYRDYEYLYLIKDGKRIIKLSEFYHHNYPEIKNEIAQKCKKLKP